MLLVYLFLTIFLSIECTKPIESLHKRRSDQLPVECDRGLWAQFKSSYNKQYKDAAEDEARFRIYCGNLQKIHRHNTNGKGKTFTLGVNQFTDRSEKELIGRSGLKPQTSGFSRNNIKTPITHRERRMNCSDDQLPAQWDWSEDSRVVSRVRSQGDCGACWAFATIGMVEGQERPKKGETVTMLSEQNLIDCNETGDGCEGGESITALVDLKIMGGLMRLADYPYLSNATLKRQQCKMVRSKIVPFTSRFGDITRLPFEDETCLKRTLYEYGPIMVEYHSTMDFYAYSEGVFYKPNCLIWGNHMMLLVGYGTDSRGRDYWKVKNSWSQKWGQKGFGFVARNRSNNCGIATRPFIIVPEKPKRADGQ